ncbi:MAG: YciI family protein [Rhodospirillales bacterium]|nr:YciI family protein [Rhodospirillales bacterium]
MKVMVIVKANADTEAGVLPGRELLSQMLQFNEELLEAGILLSGDGLKPSAKGVRVGFPGGAVVDGPFAETKELVAGFWLWQVTSMQEAIAWIRRSPFQRFPQGDVEIRPLYEPEDFGEAFTPELRAKEARLCAEASRNRT